MACSRKEPADQSDGPQRNPRMIVGSDAAAGSVARGGQRPPSTTSPPTVTIPTRRRRQTLPPRPPNDQPQWPRYQTTSHHPPADSAPSAHPMTGPVQDSVPILVAGRLQRLEQPAHHRGLPTCVPSCRHAVIDFALLRVEEKTARCGPRSLIGCRPPDNWVVIG